MVKKSAFFLLILLSAFAAAKGSVSIDAPDAIESQMPIKVEVSIDDPNIFKYVSKVYFQIRGGGAQYYLEGTEEILQYEMEYNGEKELSIVLWGSYDDDYMDNTINFTIDFYSDHETISKDFDPADMGYMYKVATLSKLIEVIPVRGTASFPSYESCPLEERSEPQGVSYYDCRYEGDDKHPRVASAKANFVRHACIPGDYQKQNNIVGCSHIGKEKLGAIEKSGKTSVEINSKTWGLPYAGEGSSEGWIRVSTDWSESTKYTDEDGNVKYRVIYFVSFYQKSGWVDFTGEFSRTMWLEKDEIESEKGKIIGDAEAFVRSVSFLKQGSPDSGKEYRAAYINYLPGKQVAGHYVHGHVLDINKDPLPYMRVQAISEDKTYEGTTDLNGNYEIELADLKLKEGEEANVTVMFHFNYLKKEKNYFKLYFHKPDTAQYFHGQFGKDVLVSPGKHGELNMILDGSEDPDLISNMHTYEELRDHAVIYFRMHEAVEFATERLHLELDHKLPVEVLVGKDDKETLYSPGQSMIKIALSDQSYLSSNNPRNREYHEFAHHIMYDLYGKWPEDSEIAGTRNHDGLLNPSTADSYTEGFAEFMALAMAKFHGYKDADIYASFGSMEDNYKPWSARGYYEELAIASLLWDMHDAANEEGDSLSMPIDDIWRVLAVERANFYEYYEAFRERFPEKKNDFDELFKLHGFFQDTREGDGNWSAHEPVRDVNRNGRWDAGEFFVDLSCTGSPCNLTYEEGMKIGPAATYQRKARTQAVMLPDAFLKVDPEGPRFYKITVDYEDPQRETYSYMVERRGDRIYVQPRPDDTYAKITIVPESQDFTYKQKYEVTNTILLEGIYFSGGKGYYGEHDFKLTRVSAGKDPEYALGFEPSFTSDENKDKQLKETLRDSEPGKKAGFGWLIWIPLFGIAGFLGYRYATGRNTKKFTHNVLGKAQSGIKELGKDMKKNLLPRAKAGAIKMHETFKRDYLPKIKAGAREAKNAAVKVYEGLHRMAKDGYSRKKNKG